MPYFPPTATPFTRSQTSVTLVDYHGEKATISVPNLENSDTATALATAIGNVSNAAVVRHNTTLSAAIPVGEAKAFDEASSEVASKLQLVFQSTTDGSIVRIGVPAPDASLFALDGYTFEPTALNGGNDLVNAIRAYLGTQYVLNQGYFVSTARGARRSYAVPGQGLLEPDDGAGELPSGEPDAT